MVALADIEATQFSEKCKALSSFHIDIINSVLNGVELIRIVPRLLN